MNREGYPESYWPQQYLSLSQEKSEQDVNGEVQDDTELAHYNTEMDSAGLYEERVGLGSSNVNFPEMNSNYEWFQRQQIPATEGERSVGIPSAFSAVSMHPANLNIIPPHQAHASPNFAQMGPQIPNYHLNYPIRQDEYEHFTGCAPFWAPQLAGVDDVQSYTHEEGMAGMRSDDWWFRASPDGDGACTLEISERPGSGGGEFAGVEFVNGSGLSPWTMSTTAVGEYGAQAQQESLPGYTNGAQPVQSPYDHQTHEYVQQNGEGVMPGLVQMHVSTPWGTPQQYVQLVSAGGLAESSIPWAVQRTNSAFLSGQSYPSVHGAPLHSGAHAGGARTCPNGFNALSTGLTSSSAQHWWGGSVSYTPVNAPSAIGVTLVPPNVMAENTMGDTVTAPPARRAYMAALNLIELGALQLSRTRTGRSGPKRGSPGQKFEPNLEKVQQRLGDEGADAGAIESLRSHVFLDGIITRAALKVPMSSDQRRTRNGTQKYMLLVEIVPYCNEEVDHRCLLCPSQARPEFKNREDTLRHFYKDHFGLSVDCDHCGHKFWLEKELAKHVTAKHGQS